MCWAGRHGPQTESIEVVQERDDEVLHGLERPEDLEAAAQHSRRWFAGLELLDEG